jgi:hypothetical protein
MFKLILTNGVDDYEITFKVRDTNIAKKWYSELSKNYPLYETERFTNWGTLEIISKLNEHIQIINEYDKLIEKTLSSNPTQEELNLLHKYFEDLRGDVIHETNWWKKAPEKIKKSVEQFNVLIHQLEANTRTKNHPTVVVTFKDRPILDLDTDDLKYFTYRWKKGTVYINYCQVGKTVLDVFKDNDKLAQGVKPQIYYSADFMVKFGPTIPYTLYLFRKICISAWYQFQRFNFEHSNIGMIPVADLAQDIDIDTMINFNKVKDIVCL